MFLWGRGGRASLNYGFIKLLYNNPHSKSVQSYVFNWKGNRCTKLTPMQIICLTQIAKLPPFPIEEINHIYNIFRMCYLNFYIFYY